jgi:cyanate lyase
MIIMKKFDFIKNKAYLLDSKREEDLPIPIFKSFAQLIEENQLLIIVTISLIVSILILILFIKKRKKDESHDPKPEPTDPYEDALLNIKSLQNQNPSLPAKPFVFRLSEILRIYVERVFKVPAMELTGEEFMREIASHTFFQNRYDKILREFIEQGDRIKYSKEDSDSGQMNLLMETALHFVKDTHKKLEESKDVSSKANS